MLKRSLAIAAIALFWSHAALAGFDEGRDAYNHGRWIQAIINLRPAVEAGDARAMILLANMYLDGHGVGQDSKEAFQLYHSAAVKENTDGMVAIAAMYQRGEGIVANTPLAVGWFARAARLGNLEAAFFYAIHMYQGSHGKDFDIKPDHVESYKWFKIVAAHTNNKKLSRAAAGGADRVAAKLTHDEIVKGDREVANWKPESPDEIGPNPEDKYLADFNAKKKDGTAPNDDKAAPKDEKKPDDKDKKAGDKKDGAKDQPKEEEKKAADDKAKPADDGKKDDGKDAAKEKAESKDDDKDSGTSLEQTPAKP